MPQTTSHVCNLSLMQICAAGDPKDLACIWAAKQEHWRPFVLGFADQV